MKLLVSTSYTVKCKREVGLFSLDTRKPIQSRSSDLTVAATEMNCLQMTVPKNKVEEEKGGGGEGRERGRVETVKNFPPNPNPSILRTRWKERLREKAEE